MNSPADVFYSIAAQDDNLGDVAIRREVMSWITSTGLTVHVFVGAVDHGYVDAVGVPPEAVIHHSSPEFVGLWLNACRRRTAHLAFAPGPRIVAAGVSAARAAGRHLAMTTLTRRTGGSVVGVGGAYAGPDGSQAARLYRASARQMNHQSVRDRQSCSLLGERVVLVPDVAFTDSHPEPSPPSDPVLAISLRQMEVKNIALDELKSLVIAARRADVRPVVVTQVRRDSSFHARLAQELDVDALLWPDDRSHREQFDRVEGLYRRTVIVFTNRLHSAVFAARRGAIVVDAVRSPNSKVAQTLGHVLRVERAATVMDDGIDRVLARRDEVCGRIEDAAQALAAERAVVIAALQAPDSFPTRQPHSSSRRRGPSM